MAEKLSVFKMFSIMKIQFLLVSLISLKFQFSSSGGDTFSPSAIATSPKPPEKPKCHVCDKDENTTAEECDCDGVKRSFADNKGKVSWCCMTECKICPEVNDGNDALFCDCKNGKSTIFMESGTNLFQKCCKK